MVVRNPYWDIVKDIPDSRFGRGRRQPRALGVDFSKPQTIFEQMTDPARLTREDLVKEYSWAIPHPDAVQWLADEIRDMPVVEIGAGTGYWAGLLRQYGITVRAFDEAPPDRMKNGWHTPRETVWIDYTEADKDRYWERSQERWAAMFEAFAQIDEAIAAGADMVTPPAMPAREDVPDGGWLERPIDGVFQKIWAPIEIGGPADAARFPDHALFLCWPPFKDPMAADALTAYTGDHLFYIGEFGGANADDTFFDLLRSSWAEYGTCPHHVQWEAQTDQLVHFRRIDTL